MDIIIQNAEVVNINNSFGDEIGTNEAQKWAQKKQKAAEMARKMIKIGYQKRGERMKMCANFITGKVCNECGHLIVNTRLCRDRLCPICTWRLSMRRFAAMYTIVDGLQTAYPERKWWFVTLTVKNCPAEELGSTITEMLRTWNCITSHRQFREHFDGYARSLEITYNPRTKTIHPHIHVLVMAATDNADPGFIVRRWLASGKCKMTYLAQDVREVQADDGEIPLDALLETYKYSVKDKDTLEMPLSVLKEVADALKSRRLVSFGGKIKEYAKLCQIDSLDDAGENDEQDAAAIISKCTRCGSESLASIIGEWAASGYIWRRFRV